MKLHFRHRMFLGIAIIEIIVMAVLVLVIKNLVHAEQSGYVHRRAETLAGMLAVAVHEPVEKGERANVQKLLDEVTKNADVSYVRVLVNDKEFAFSGERTSLLKGYKDDHSFDQVNDGIYDVHKDIVYSLKEKAKGELNICVQTGLDVAKLNAPEEQLLVKVGGLAMLAVLLSSGLAGLFGVYLTRQIELLKEAANKVAGGDFQARVPVVGRDELSETAEAFNAMAQHVREVYDNLQDAVAARTEELRVEKERAELLSMTDELTGLMNRRAVFSSARIEVAQARRSSLPVSIGVLDIDFFKRINDTYGHPTGDAVIRRVSNVLKDSLREADIVGRIGGEEFMVILANTLPEDAVTVMERIRRAVEAEVIVHGGVSVSCTVSCGLATLGAADDLDSLVARADECLYQAKNGGRNQVVS